MPEAATPVPFSPAAPHSPASPAASPVAPPPTSPPPPPQNIRVGREQSGARAFLLERPTRVRATRSGNDILDVWTVRTYLTSAEPFPGPLRSAGVVALRRVRLNPVEAAIVQLAERTGELAAALETAADGPNRGAAQLFTGKLQGCIDPAVSGGVANYAPLLSGEFRVTHPEIAEDLDAPGGGKALLIARGLLPALAAHAHVLQRAIRVHAEKCPADNVPMHKYLEEKLPALLAQLREWGVDTGAAT
jgi:hypothetical protein